MQPVRALSQERSSGLSEGWGGACDCAGGNGYLCAAAETGDEDMRHPEES